MQKRYLVKPNSKVRLRDWDPDDTNGLAQGPDLDKRVERDLEDLFELQELLWAARTHAVLVVLQGIDTAGKDGTIRHVFSGVNPQGCHVVSFKVPTELERSHDYLWRYHMECPRKGEIVIFNRSHYEAVLVERVHSIVPKEVWKRRFDEINRFEKMLADEGTLIVKFMLTVSKEEQRRRLLERERNPDKRWKMSRSDWKERKLWPQYQLAFDDVLSRTSTAHAPWIVVPSDKKWFRNMLVADVLTDVLKPFRRDWKQARRERGETALAGE